MAESIYPQQQINIAGGATSINQDTMIALMQQFYAQYDATLPTITDGNFSNLQLDINGRLLALINGIYNVTLPTLSDGQKSPPQLDVNGRLLVSSTPLGEPTVVLTTYFDYGSTSIDNTNWTQIVASTGSTKIIEININETSGETVELALGSIGLEQRLLLMSPGGPGTLKAVIPVNSRVSVRAISTASINSGQLIINYIG